MAIGPGAVDAAENLSFFFNAMADDPAIAVWAGWRERVNRAFKAVEHMPFSVGDELERFIVIIPAHFALSHI